MRFPRRLFTLVVVVVILWNLYVLHSRSSAGTVAPNKTKTSSPSRHPQLQQQVHEPETVNKDVNSNSPVTKTADRDSKNEGNVKPKESSEAKSVPSPKAHKVHSEHSDHSDHVGDHSAGRAGDHTSSHKQATGKTNAEPEGYRRALEEISRVIEYMVSVHPDVGVLEKYNRNIQEDRDLLHNGELPCTSSVLGLYLQVDDSTRGRLKEAHSKVVSALPEAVPPNAFSGRGLVMTGGGKYFPPVVMAIKWLRERNINLPIEVFMQDDTEWEPKFCDEVFPSLNTKCVNLEEVYGKSLLQKVNSKYALKPLAILASQYEEVYFMDADSMPFDDPEPVFNCKPYNKYGLVMNTDYWERFISPHYYDIAGVTLGGRARGNDKSEALRQADRENAVPGMSTESGQMMIDKSRHFRSMLLTLYYNIFGVSTYFPLLMQGGPGEGDKDTYSAAAIVLGEEYYQTLRRPVTLGYQQNGFHGFAMVQPHPENDYAINMEKKPNAKELFLNLHSNSIKANPKYLLIDHNEHVRGLPPLRKARYYGTLEYQHKETLRPNDDYELKYFELMGDVVCDWARQRGWVPRDWEDQDMDRLCGYLAEHVEWLRDPASHNIAAPDDDSFSVDHPPKKVGHWESKPLLDEK